MTPDMAPMRPAVFLWENFGPYHRDRLRAVGHSGRRAIGIQFAGRSDIYGWETCGDELDIRTLRAAGEALSSWRLAWRLVKACRRIGRADYFLCHYERGAVFLTALLLRLAGCQVFALFESKFDDYPRRWWREIAKVILFLPYSGALVPTPRSRDYLAFLGLRRRVSLGYSTVSVQRVIATAAAPPAPDGVAFAQRDWIAVARLVPKKNLALALDAYARWLALTARPRDLHLCGSGPLEAMLRVQADALGITRHVHFHGFMQAEAVAAQLARSLALLLPSTEEQFGLVVIEAQAMGLPVIVTPQVGAADVLVRAGINGFVANPGDPDAWAALMLRLSENEKEWSAMAAQARDGADRGDVARFVEGVAALSS